MSQIFRGMPIPQGAIAPGSRAERRLQKKCKHPADKQWGNFEGRMGVTYCAACGLKREETVDEPEQS